MEHVKRIYAAWMDKPTLVLLVPAALLGLSIAAFGLHGGIVPPAGPARLSMLGEMAFGLFIGFCILLVLIGWHFDHQPGRTIILGVSALLVGGMLNLFFDIAVSGGWLPVWVGLLLGVLIAAGYVAWEIHARFALVALGLVGYTLLVTTGFFLSVEDALPAPVFVGLPMLGGYMYGMICFLYDPIEAGARDARREAMAHHIRRGVPRSLRPILLWSAAALLIALPALLIGAGLFRSLGLLLLIGALVGLIATLSAPAPLLLVTRNPALPAVPERRARRRRP